jgi:hypothetical protein
VPTLGRRFLSSDNQYWGTDRHYSAVLMPVVSFALADAHAGCRHSPRPWLRSCAAQLPAAVAAAALAPTTTLPLSALTRSAAYRTPPEAAAIDPDLVVCHTPHGPPQRHRLPDQNGGGLAYERRLARKINL